MHICEALIEKNNEKKLTFGTIFAHPVWFAGTSSENGIAFTVT